MGSTVKQEGKYQYQYAPEPTNTSRMAGNVVTVPAELQKEIDPRQRYRAMAEQPFGQEPLVTEQPLNPPPQSAQPQQQNQPSQRDAKAVDATLLLAEYSGKKNR